MISADPVCVQPGAEGALTAFAQQILESSRRTYGADGRYDSITGGASLLTAQTWAWGKAALSLPAAAAGAETEGGRRPGATAGGGAGGGMGPGGAAGAPAGAAPAAAARPWHSANCLAQELVELIAHALHALPQPSSPHGTLAPVLLRYRQEVVAAQPGRGRARRRRGVLGACCGAPPQ